MWSRVALMRTYSVLKVLFMRLGALGLPLYGSHQLLTVMLQVTLNVTLLYVYIENSGLLLY